jgi:hypothetical protein
MFPAGLHDTSPNLKSETSTMTKQLMLPIPKLLTAWEDANLTGRWVRKNSNGREEFVVYLHGGRWIITYPVVDLAFKPENAEQERQGFLSVWSAREYCDRAAKRQGFVFQG